MRIMKCSVHEFRNWVVNRFLMHRRNINWMKLMLSNMRLQQAQPYQPCSHRLRAQALPTKSRRYFLGLGVSSYLCWEGQNREALAWDFSRTSEASQIQADIENGKVKNPGVSWRRQPRDLQVRIAFNRVIAIKLPRIVSRCAWCACRCMIGSEWGWSCALLFIHGGTPAPPF